MELVKFVKEFDIKVPWGIIAVKTWGNENNQPVLVFHGRFDNICTFDRLIPQLPSSFYYIGFDFPGHGKSSHFPPYILLHSTDFIIPCRIVMDHFKRDKYIALGHSFGGQQAFQLARVYPERIQKLICLDVLMFGNIETSEVAEYIRMNIEAMLCMQEKSMNGSAPSYTYEEALKKFSYNRFNGSYLLREAADVVLKRSLIPTGDGKYRFSTDQRMKAYMDPLQDARYILQSIRDDCLTLPILVIFAKFNESTKGIYEKYYYRMEDMKNLTIKYIDGHHDLHNNYPERVAGIISEFMLMQHSKL